MRPVNNGGENGSEIELAQQRSPELAHHLSQAVATQLGHPGLHRVREAAQEPQVCLDDGLDAWAPDFQHDRCAVLEPGLVDLRQ